MCRTLSHVSHMSGLDYAVQEHTDPCHLELDDVAALEPAAVAVLEDAARPDRARAEDVPGSQVRVTRSVNDDGVPGVVHIRKLPAGALLPVDTRDHRPSRTVELVRRHDEGPQARGEVLAFRRPQADLHLRALEIACRPVVHDRESGDPTFTADDCRHLELVVELVRVGRTG